MPRFWNNPEFVRHRRAELRPVRAISVAALVAVVCVLVGLACWANERAMLESIRRGAETYATDVWKQRLADAERDFGPRVLLLLYKWLIGLQGAALTFWTLFSCAQSVSGERDRKTWDFQRTTRLTPAEILIGKLLGEPVLVYFAVLCAAPITLIAGLAGGLSLGTVLSVLIFLAAVSLFLGLGGMWLSTLLETRTRGVGLIGALGLYFATVMMFEMRGGGLPGLAAFSPLMVFFGLMDLGDDVPYHNVPPVLFGHEVPWLLMNVLLCASFSAWLALMLVRNLKRDYQEIRPLSRWQAVGCAAFLNFLIYALLSPAKPMDTLAGMARQGWFPDARVVAAFAVGINGLILFLMGLATLTPHERLKVWRRKRATGEAAVFADDGLPWPWLGMSAVVAYALMVWGLLAWNSTLPLEMNTLQTAAVRLLIVLVFVTRDVLFLQWCMLTRLRQPVVKGVLYLGLYYAAAAVLTALAAISIQQSGNWAMALLTPVQAFDPDVKGLAFPTVTYVGLALQIGFIGAVLAAIGSRLQRPTQVGAAV